MKIQILQPICLLPFTVVLKSQHLLVNYEFYIYYYFFIGFWCMLKYYHVQQNLICLLFQVIGGQARSQFSQFPPYGLSQGLGQASAFSQQSMYLQTAHPPPSAAPDMYQSPISQFRIQARVFIFFLFLLVQLLAAYISMLIFISLVIYCSDVS